MPSKTKINRSNNLTNLIIIVSILFLSSVFISNDADLKGHTQVSSNTLELFYNQSKIRESVSYSLIHSIIDADQLNAIHNRSLQTLQKLAFLSHSNTALTEHYSTLSQLINQQFNLVNDLKSSSAIFRNSYNYLPTAVQNCHKTLSSKLKKQQLAQLSIHAIKADKSALTAKIKQFSSGTQALSESCNLLVKHAETLVIQDLKRQGVYQKMSALPVQEAIMTFHQSVVEQYKERNQSAQQYGYGLLALNIIFLLFIFFSLRSSMQKGQQFKVVNKRLLYQKHQQKTLSKINHLCATSPSESDILHQFVNIVNKRFKLSACWIADIDSQALLHPIAISGYNTEIIKSIKIASEGQAESLANAFIETFRTESPVICNAFQRSEYAENCSAFAVQNNIQAVATFPIFINRNVESIVALYSEQIDFFTRDTVSMLEAITHSLSSGIERIRLIKEQEQQRVELSWSAIAFEALDAIVIMDSNHRIIQVNKSYNLALGYAPQEVIGVTWEPYQLPTMNNTDESLWDYLEYHASWGGEIINRRKNGELYPTRIYISVLKNDEGVITHYISHEVDISKEKTADAEIAYLRQNDELTGLPNKNALTEKIHQLLVQSKPTYNLLFLVNIVRFKQINESLGHLAGDKVLQSTANRFKEMDIPNIIDKTVSRIGGDEFAILISTHIKTDQVLNTISTTLLQFIQSCFTAPFEVSNQNLAISCNLGVTVFQGTTQKSDMALYQEAHTALHRAKLNPETTAQFFEKEMQTIAMEEFELEHEINNAVENNEFEMFYQPQIDIVTNQICGAEALIRWRKPSGKIISPFKFIPIMEKNGAIITVGYWLMAESLKQFKTLPSFDDLDITLSINLSAVQLQDPRLVDTVETLISQYSFPVHRLYFEVTESALMINVFKAIEKLEALSALGIKIAIDDFGTGYSSFAYLKKMPVSELKIDKSFIDDIHHPKDQAITKSVISLAHSLGIKAIAEGVETGAQLALLKELKCDRVQGYAYSKPIEFTAFAAFLAKGISK